ncbi:MAG TPA: hypothetical protein VEL47_03135 [Myxococcota bacterium]|nr:hypothetical protein [Myxococcota bacterium]
MPKTLISLVATLLICVAFSCKTRQPTEQTDFGNLYKIASSFDKNSGIFSATVSLEKTLHAYALGEKTGQPVSLEISPKNGWAADGPANIPRGVVKKLGALGEATVLEGSFTISQKLKAGLGPGEALLHLQVCSDTACDRPRVHHIKL